MGAVHAAGTAAGWGQGLPGGPQLPPHHATTVTAPPGVQAAPPPPPPPAQMMAYPMQQFQVTITLSIPSIHACKCAPYLFVWCLLANTGVFRFLHTFASCPCYVQKQFRRCRYWLVNVARGNSIRHQKDIESMCWRIVYLYMYILSVILGNLVYLILDISFERPSDITWYTKKNFTRAEQ